MRRRIAVCLALLLAVVGIALPLESASAAAGAPFKLPYRAGAAYVITQTPGSGFSHNDDYNRHAVDFAMPSGTPIVASAGGTVHSAGWAGGGGNVVLISHGNNRCSQYAHLSSIGVRPGQRVVQGQQVARSGSTGNSTGPHLHWNIVHCNSSISREIPDSVERGTSYPTGLAPVSKNRMGSRGDGERVSDFSGDGKSDVLGVTADGRLLYYPHNGNDLSSPKKIGHNFHTFKHVMSADWSGDGAADVIGVTSTGKLMYYPNNGYTLYKSKPVQIGHGWQTFKQVMAADFSGDGKADVLGVDASGRLWYYPHNGNGLSAPRQIGHNFHTFKHVMSADWSGDGAADVIGVTSTGKLMYYGNNGYTLYKSKPVQIGHGWQTFKHVMASDWSGDGKADILGVDANGKLWYYPHNGNGLGARKQIGHGWQTFPHVM